MPRGCAVPRRLLAPAHRAPRLLRLRPSRDAPRWGPSLFARIRASDTPPRHTRSVPAASGGMAAGTRRAESKPPSRGAAGWPCVCSWLARRTWSCTRTANGRVVVTTVPRARGAMAPERAGPERPDRRVETLDPTESLSRVRGTARVRTPVCACSVARVGASEGCARCAARATARSPRDKEKASRSERNRALPATRRARQESLTQ